MDKSEISDELFQLLTKLNRKYEAMGQDLNSYLNGLLQADFLTYWDYIHLDTLLSLQSPKTPLPDEKIFIVYHQITELYFQLILHELEQICNNIEDTDRFVMKMKRVNNYFEHLVSSFEVMQDGMEKEQFLQFRMALLPASGFQSVQYRKIEIHSTDAVNLTVLDQRQGLDDYLPEDELYRLLYWKNGATELATGRRTLTLEQFDAKYTDELTELMREYRQKNLWYGYQKFYAGREPIPELVEVLRKYDRLSNVYWPLAHYKSAAKYLHRDENLISASGGTNWQKYLPPRFQRIQYFPTLWSDRETEEWGRKWVEKEVLKQEKE